ncbi:MAG: Oligoendopeptidase F, plasmid [Anaerolineales bacterium]|nr:Oligoendopeptidase F, plasmid [Anaerolineales bacterium]
MNYSDINPLDWDTIQPHVDALLATDLHGHNVEAWLQQWSDLTAVLQESAAQIYRDVSENTADEEAEQRFLTLVDDIIPQAKVAEQALKNKLLAIEDYTPSADTAMMMNRFRTEASIFREDNVPLQSRLMKLENEYEKLVGGMTIEWEGKEETLPQAQLHLREQDRATREKAWRLIMERYAADRERINKLYLKMLPLRQQVAQNAGFNDYRAYKWKDLARFDYTPDDCFTFHHAIEHEVVPLATRLHTERTEKLALETLRPWDTEVDLYGEPLSPFEDAAKLEEGGYRILQQVDPALAQHFAAMRDGFLDLASRPNKRQGGYCRSFPISGKAYIFMNAVGTHRDVNTLLHEAGHAFHFTESLRHPLIWNHDGPMEFCEVASMAMELLSAPYLEKNKGGFYDEDDARRAYAEQLRGIVEFLPYMAMVDGFQHWVYVDAPADVTPADLNAKWSELWDRFMAGIDYSGLEAQKETGWHRKTHIFSTPFYYVEYGLAQLGALQVWRNALEDQAQAVADYRAALALGDTRPLPELFETAGATFAFDRETVRELMNLVQAQLAILDTGD